MQNSSLGYMILGPLSINNKNENNQIILNITESNLSDEENINKLFQKVYEMEFKDENKEYSNIEEKEFVEKLFVFTHKRTFTGRYEVRIPINPLCEGIGESRNIALKQFYQLERRLERNLELKEKYIQFMREYKSLGYMIEAKEVVNKNWAYWIPHHPVLKKFRVVFNASSITSTGESLNSIQMVGAKLQCDLHYQIMRFRKHKIGVTTDVCKMYNQVCVPKDQWDLQRIFWRESPKHELKEYNLTVTTFGLSSSAFNAVRAMIQCAKDYGNDFPHASNIIQTCFYMDDALFGGENEAIVKQLCKEIEFVLSQGGFELKHWASNSKCVEASLTNTSKSTQLIGDDDETKILGLRWLKNTDHLSIFVKRFQTSNKPTKREILTKSARFYDPNGFIAPILVVPKLILQEAWKIKGLKWDDGVPDELAKAWFEFENGLPMLNDYKIPRWIQTCQNRYMQLHGFCDASKKAYGIVIYARVIDENNAAHCSILFAKSRVAPLQELTIPRLELQAAVLLCEYMREIREKCEFNNADTFLWSDSMVVLHWIKKNPYELKTFVCNRIKKIQNASQGWVWSHMESADNPADLASRGMNAKDFIQSTLWREAPAWLKKNQCEWPVTKLKVTVQEYTEMKKETKNNQNAIEKIFNAVSQNDFDLLNRFSSWDKILNVTCYIMRFINILSKKYANCDKHEIVTVEERQIAIMFWVKYAQNKAFSAEIANIKAKKKLTKSKLIPLNPFLDGNGILRVGGRIDKANIDYSMRHPIIIPNKSRISYFLLRHAHLKTLHGGAQTMMRFIRSAFWIPRIREEIRQYINKCVTCTRYAQKEVQQIMAELPMIRITPAKPFQFTGVDMAGPFNMRITEKINMNTRARANLPELKCWVAVFVCLVTRAVHLEATEGMSAEDFLGAYQKFTSRRGKPQIMYSDHGTNFIGADTELQQAYLTWKDKAILKYVSDNETKWKYITPSAPHEGGIWEACVKSMKHHLKRIMGPQKYSIKGLGILLTSVEACLNSRPLCAMSDDPNDCEALTPAHFLIGRPLQLPLYEQMEAPPKTSKAFYRAIQFQLQSFWKQWSTDYLQTLMQRPKWREEQENLKVDQLVLIKHDNTPPTHWIMGRVIETFTGEDNKVRSVKLKTQTSTLERSVRKLCVLPTDSDLDYWTEN